MARSKIPTYQPQELPPADSGEVKTPYVFDDAARARMYGAQVLEEAGKRAYWLSRDLAKKAKEEVERRQAIEFAYSKAQLIRSLGEAKLQLENEEIENIPVQWEKSKQKAYTTVRSNIEDIEVLEEFDKYWELASAQHDIDVAAFIANRKNDRALAQWTDALDTAASNGDVDEIKQLETIAPTWIAETKKQALVKAAEEDAIFNRERVLIMQDPVQYEIPEDLSPELQAKLVREREYFKNRYEEEFRTRQKDLLGDLHAQYYATGRIPITHPEIERLYENGEIDESMRITMHNWVGALETQLAGQTVPLSLEQIASIRQMAISYVLDPTVHTADAAILIDYLKSAGDKSVADILDGMLKTRESFVSKLREGTLEKKLGDIKLIDASEIYKSSEKYVKKLISKGVIDESLRLPILEDFVEILALWQSHRPLPGKEQFDLQESFMNVINKYATGENRIFDVNRDNHGTLVKYTSDLYKSLDLESPQRLAEISLNIGIPTGDFEEEQIGTVDRIMQKLLNMLGK